MANDDPGQVFDGRENVLIIGPRELVGAAVRLDGKAAGYLWSATHVRNTGVDQYYRPSFPLDVPADACATRLYISDDRLHELLISSAGFTAIHRTIDVSMRRPLLVRITRNELATTP